MVKIEELRDRLRTLGSKLTNPSDKDYVSAYGHLAVFIGFGIFAFSPAIFTINQAIQAGSLEAAYVFYPEIFHYAAGFFALAMLGVTWAGNELWKLGKSN
jgi:hypothetical protein